MTQENSASEEQIRKVYAKDLKRGEPVHTVFRATKKERLASRAGKPFLAVSLQDRTGEVDARVFENVEAAEGAFAAGDYLLLKGKVGAFHGKTQIVIDRLERLDPGPIDPKEFDYTAPPEAPAAKEAPAPREVKEPREPKAYELRAHEETQADAPTHRQARARLLKLLDDPAIALGLDALLRHLEREVEERVAARAGLGPRVEKKPRLEHRPRPVEPTPRPEAKRDPSLPEGLAFKPLTALIGEGGSGNSTPGGGQG